METPTRAYISGAAGVLASRVISVVAGIFSLWFLARILSIEEFSGYVSAMAILVLLGYSGGLGIERAMLLRISERASGKGILIGRALMIKTGRTVLISSGVIAALAVAITSGMPTLRSVAAADWIVRLWPIIPATALSLVLIHWYQANHRVGISQLMNGLNDGARCAAFGMVFALGLGATSVANSAIIAAILPFALLWLLSIGRTEREPSAIGVADLLAGLQFLVLRVATMGMRQFDLIAMGFLAGAADTAAYAVASRIGDIAQLGKQAFLNTYAPRARLHLAHGDQAAVEREYQTTRVLATLVTFGVAIGAILVGQIALDLVGNFSSGYPVLLLIISSHLVSASFGEHTTLLSMSGDLTKTMLNRVVSVLLFLFFLGAAVPIFGGLGAAMAFLLATMIHEIFGALILQKTLKIPAINKMGILALCLALVGTIGSGLASFDALVGVALIVFAGLIIIIKERHMMLKLLNVAKSTS